MRQDTMSLFYEVEREVKPFFNQARNDHFGGLSPRELSDAQCKVYVLYGYAEYFKSIPTKETQKRIHVLGKVIKYAKSVSITWNRVDDVFEMCNLVTKE